MARDYKHRVPGYRHRQPRNANRNRAWIVLALAVAASMVAWLIYQGLDDNALRPQLPRTTQLPAPPIYPHGKPAEKTDPPKPEARKAEPVKKPEEANRQFKEQEPRFSFYKILPEKEVIIPENEIRTIKREESLGKNPAGNLYLLQAGSFPNIHDAEKLKGQLAQMKVRAKIENVQVENNAWYRVNIGPFDNLLDADRVRSYLRSNQIDSVVQKAKSR